MEIFSHTKWWDYSSYPFDIRGRVCLRNSPLLGYTVPVVHYLIHPTIQEFVRLFSPGIQTMFYTTVLFGSGYDLFNAALVLLRKNKDSQGIEGGIRELRQEFTSASITSLQGNLGDAVTRVLDSINADEILLEHIERLRQCIASLHTKRKRTHTRLQKTPPTRIETISRTSTERLLSTINEYRKREDGRQMGPYSIADKFKA